jgi:hypothetical protein
MRRLTVLDPKDLASKGIDAKAYYETVGKNIQSILEEGYAKGILMALNHIILKGSAKGLKGDHSGFQVDLSMNTYKKLKGIR